MGNGYNIMIFFYIWWKYIVVNDSWWKSLIENAWKKHEIKWPSLAAAHGVRFFGIPKVILDENWSHEAIDYSFSQNDDNGNIIYQYPYQRANKATPEKFEILHIPCHSLAVEWHIKIMCDALLKSSSAATRYDIVKSTGTHLK